MVGVRRRPGAQHPAWSSAGALVAVGGPASLPACIQPGTTPSEQPDPASPLDQQWLLAGRATSPRGPRPLQAPAAAHPISAQTACLIWMSSCPSPLGGQHSSPHPERPEQQTFSLPESGGRGLRSGCGGPHPGLRGWAPCLRHPAPLRPLLCPMLSPPGHGCMGLRAHLPSSQLK